MSECKGTIIIFVRKKVAMLGRDVEQVFLQQFSPEEKKSYLSVGSGDWVPLELVTMVFSKAAVLLHRNMDAGLQQLGQELAKEHLTGIYRFFLQQLTVPVLIRQASLLWRLYYRKGIAYAEDAGTGQTQLRFCVDNYPGLPKVHRFILEGFLRGTLELAQVENIQITREEKNPSAWIWVITYDDPPAYRKEM